MINHRVHDILHNVEELQWRNEKGVNPHEKVMRFWADVNDVPDDVKTLLCQFVGQICDIETIDKNPISIKKIFSKNEGVFFHFGSGNNATRKNGTNICTGFCEPALNSFFASNGQPSHNQINVSFPFMVCQHAGFWASVWVIVMPVKKSEEIRKRLLKWVTRRQFQTNLKLSSHGKFEFLEIRMAKLPNNRYMLSYDSRTSGSSKVETKSMDGRELKFCINVEQKSMMKRRISISGTNIDALNVTKNDFCVLVLNVRICYRKSSILVNID